MARVTVSESELLAALADAGPKPAPPHALTAAELREKLGLNSTALKKRLSRLKAEGRLEIWQTAREDVTGRVQGVPAYTIKPAKRPR